MSTLAFIRAGTGAPLVLLHGIGSSRHAWDPVIPALTEHFDVIAVDLPGFGDSQPLSADVESQPAALAAAVAGLLDDLDITAPHIAGNSLGGWVALELARVRPAASITLLSPAGLRRGGIPRYELVSLRASRWLAEHAAGTLNRLVNYRLGRILVLGQTHGRPTRIAPQDARAIIRAMATCRGFDATLKATATRHYAAGPVNDAPVTSIPVTNTPITVAFGSRDLLLRRHSRHLDELPPGTQLGDLPGCGHVPMADNPDAVVALITESTERASVVDLR